LLFNRLQTEFEQKDQQTHQILNSLQITIYKSWHIQPHNKHTKVGEAHPIQLPHIFTIFASQ